MQKIVILILGLVLFLLWENTRPYFPFGNNHIKRTISNFAIALTNVILARLVFTMPMLWISSHDFFVGFGLFNTIRIPDFIVISTGFIILDLWSYWWHRFNHTITFLWRFHRVHHTDTEMAASTAFRFHPIEILFSSLLRIPIFLLLGIPGNVIIWYEAILGFSALFHHSNIIIPHKTDSILRLLIVSPEMHKLHHSDKSMEFQSNYTSIFSFWDRLFKSFTETDHPENINLGLRIYREERFQQYFGILMIPFVKSGSGRISNISK